MGKKKEEDDPLLALRGLGKEMWRELGGGEKFIRELRENWYGPPVRAKKIAKPKRRSKKGPDPKR